MLDGFDGKGGRAMEREGDGRAAGEWPAGRTSPRLTLRCARQVVKDTLRATINANRHPAIGMWLVGNEVSALLARARRSPWPAVGPVRVPCRTVP